MILPWQTRRRDVNLVWTVVRVVMTVLVKTASGHHDANGCSYSSHVRLPSCCVQWILASQIEREDCLDVPGCTPVSLKHLLPVYCPFAIFAENFCQCYSRFPTSTWIWYYLIIAVNCLGYCFLTILSFYFGLPIFPKVIFTSTRRSFDVSSFCSIEW